MERRALTRFASHCAGEEVDDEVVVDGFMMTWGGSFSAGGDSKIAVALARDEDGAQGGGE